MLSLIKNSIDAEILPPTQLAEWLEKNASSVEMVLALNFFEHLDEDKDDLLNEHYENINSFKNRLFSTWEGPLKRLDSLVYMCTEILNEINSEYRVDLSDNSSKLNISTRLHARALQVSSEISSLLKGGFADGAMARWRTLHETTAILIFIANGDEDLAERFTDFQSILRLKAANRYNKHCDNLGFSPFSFEDIKLFDAERKEIISKYEPGFRNDFGWATKALGVAPDSKARTQFKDIEEFVGLDFLRAHYGFANQYIHAGIDSIGFKLGTSISNKDVLLCGPSNEGLIEPIQCTSLSLIQATQAIMSVSPNDERLLCSPLLWLWHEKLKEEVVAASDALQKKGEPPQECAEHPLN